MGTEPEPNGAGTMPDLDRMIKLFTGPNSSELYERHAAAIDRLCKSNPTGFAIRDLPRVQQIFELTLGLLKNGQQMFLEPACQLLRTLSKPFVKRTSTDEFKMLNNIANMLSSVGKVFSADYSASIQLVACQMLHAFSTAHGSRPSALDRLPSPTETDTGSGPRQYHTNQTLIGRSGVIPSVIRGLATAILGANEVLMISLTSTLLSFSYMASNCTQLVDAGVLSCLPHVLGYGYTHDLTAVSVELLWNLVEYAPETKYRLSDPQPLLTRLLTIPVEPPQQQQQGAAAEEAAAVTQHRPISGTRGVSGQASPQAEASGDMAADETGGQDAADMGHDLDPSGQAAESPSVHHQGGEQEGNAVNGEERQGDEQAGEAQLDEGRDGPSSGEDGEVVVEALASTLCGLYRSALGSGFRQVDKELRNDVLVVLNLLLEAGPDFAVPCYSSGLFDAVGAVSTAPELADGSPHVKPWGLTTDDVDHEHKLLCWRATAAGSQQVPAALQLVVQQYNFLGVLLQYISTSDAPPPAVRRWNADQLNALRSAALSSLYRVAPLAAESYVAVGGLSELVAFVRSSHGQNVLTQHTEGALRHLYCMCQDVPDLAESFGAEGLVPVLLDIVQDVSSPGSAGGQPEGVRHFALMLLSLLCTVNAENLRRLRKAQGVAVLLDQLQRLIRADPTLPSPFAVAVLDAVWCCVVPDRKNLARFLVDEGMDALLSLLERGNKGHRPTILSVLADMLENQRSHSFVHEWRSEMNQQTAAHMLITMWQEEDALRGLTVDGVLSNTSRPLTGLDKRTRWVPNETVAYGNMEAERRAQLQTLVEGCSGEQLLAKIYSVLKLLGMDSLGYVSLQDRAVLCLIEKYVKFRQGEVWREIQEEFDAEGMRPTAPDRARLASGIELLEHLAKAVRDAQAQILERHVDGARQQEAKFFEDMRAQKKLEQEMRFYQKDKSQMTLAELREAKQKKETMLRNSICSFRFMDADLLDSTQGSASSSVLMGSMPMPPRVPSAGSRGGSAGGPREKRLGSAGSSSGKGSAGGDNGGGLGPLPQVSVSVQ
eukprot:CAMPEP_0202890108 /NCGR_PEP_ID=MMETSP1392-20130828/615_1 /ASSEMBLY_ACC=CAM_ASM_000868 /TAXON_ID=225041 /ORGANISM="Chlamydomonas chlamydogama, Strain SAG 11-48b" /LENGTH=1052 /DNA_ID=CAMNT_0049573609 /DNA_START=191 /DNA_END=3349 /DNA_ORIENTATION=-